LAQVLERTELAGDAHLQVVGWQHQYTGALDRVLGADLGRELRDIETDLRQLAMRDLDIDLLVLHAEEIHLGNIGHLQQLLAHRLDVVLQLPIVEAVGREREHHSIDVAELVVEKRSLDIWRQRAADVADLLAHLVPRIGDIAPSRRLVDLHEDQRFAGLAVGADLVDPRGLLQLLFELVGDLFSHLRRGGTGPVGTNHHRAEGERRIFVLTQAGESEEPARQQHHHQIAQQRSVVDRPRGKIEARAGRHGLSPSLPGRASRSPERPGRAA